MAKQPQFTILAGPNGAGKSTHGDLFISPGTFMFNGDLVFADLVRRYPHIEPERLGGGVAVQLEKDRDHAILHNSDFCFESNYSNQLAIDISMFFKEAGYEINLIYFGLPKFQDSRVRVKDRVQAGGHDVTAETVAFNRDEGIRRAKENLHLYDQITFVDNSGLFPKAVAIFRKQTAHLAIYYENVNWFNEHFKGALKKLAVSEKLKPVERLRPRKGKGPRL